MRICKVSKSKDVNALMKLQGLKPSNSNIKNLALDSISGKGIDYDVECYKCRDDAVTEVPTTSTTPVADANPSTGTELLKRQKVQF